MDITESTTSKSTFAYLYAYFDIKLFPAVTA